ncbi:MAG TPA: L-seryl-tRNA(Sec) selenium transferase [Acidimicrobiia bacterium]|nr:L-seryl-tRNA(Sec) selenium transferase [Acidimicrobiia bacterium]
MDIRDLPSVDALAGSLSDEFAVPRVLLVTVARDAIEHARAQLQAGMPADPAGDASRRIASLASSRLRNVVNATGVLLHTNLGRAPVASPDVPFYSNLEFDLEAGTRGKRGAYLRALIASVVGAEAALVVNNNAGALFLSLAAIAGRDGRVAVSRGELIEIGGSFRLPELMAATGAYLVEVGTTNRTRESDFRAAPGTIEAILKVHPSNYRVEGFTEEVPFSKMAAVATDVGAPFIADIGSGLLDSQTPWIPDGPPRWLAREPGVRQTLDQGADVVLFSGDKLLGGPQAGIAVGRGDLIDRMARHPIARALRINTPTIAALTETFEIYATGRAATLPFWIMATTPAEEIFLRTKEVMRSSAVAGSIVDGESLPGAGSVPGQTIPTPVLRLDGSDERVWRALADHDPPVITARQNGATIVNLRSVPRNHDPIVASALAGI